MTIDIAFSGRLGCGKTTVSQAVAAALHARWCSFGSVIKKIAEERGTPLKRESLQKLGENLVANSAEELCRRVLSEVMPLSDSPAVIDGLRHLKIQKILQELFKPRRLIVVFVDINDAVRFERLRLGRGLEEEEVRSLEEHSTELEVSGPIRQLADFSVDNSGFLQDTVQMVLEQLPAHSKF